MLYCTNWKINTYLLTYVYKYTHRCDMEIETGFWAYGLGNMSLQAVKLPISHYNVVGENTVLQLNILETGVPTLVVQNSSPTRLRLVGDEL